MAKTDAEKRANQKYYETLDDKGLISVKLIVPKEKLSEFKDRAREDREKHLKNIGYH